MASVLQPRDMSANSETGPITGTFKFEKFIKIEKRIIYISLIGFSMISDKDFFYRLSVESKKNI